MIGPNGVVWICSGILAYGIFVKHFKQKIDLASFAGSIFLGPISLFFILGGIIWISVIARKYKKDVN